MFRLLAVLFLVLSFGFFYYFSASEENSLVSPIGKVFGVSGQKVPVNTWFPKEPKDVNVPYNLSLGAKSALLVDFDSGEILFEKNASQKLPAASTIKIMTALVALENKKPSDSFTVSENAAKIGENSMGLTAGENLTLEELLYGLMLVSGNDAAVTIAEGIAGTEEAFVSLMNQKAVELGLSGTKFINASGLDQDGKQQYTTAYDMAIIARYVWEKYPVFGKITSTEHKYIDFEFGHKSYDLYNDTNLSTTYRGVKGIKPGFTWEAGLCLVTYAENEGKRLLGVILGSDDRRGEMKELLDFGFATYGIYVSHPALDL